MKHPLPAKPCKGFPERRPGLIWLALAALLAPPALGQGQGPLLVPRDNRQPKGAAPAHRLPAPVAASAPAAGGQDAPVRWSRDRLEFAAAALVTVKPEGWWVEDRPLGNYVFLLLAPAKPPRRWGTLPRGIWATFVPRGPHRPLQPMTPARVNRVVRTWAGGRFTVSAPAAEIRWNGHRALLLRGGRSSQESAWVVQALGVETPWGEYYAGFFAPAAQAPALERLWSRWLRHSKLQPPRLPPPPRPAAAMAPAAALLGWWKSPRGQMYLGPSGRVVLQFDRRGSFEPGPDGSLRYDRPLVQLRGTAVAREDLLLVTWTDGSQTNYRWRLHQGDLLLTDHLGRTSRLKPLARWDR